MTELYLRAHLVPVVNSPKPRAPAGHSSRVAERLHVVAVEGEERGSRPCVLAMWNTLQREPDGHYRLATPLAPDEPMQGIVLGDTLRGAARIDTLARAASQGLPALTLQEYAHTVLLRETYDAGAAFCAFDPFVTLASLATSWTPTRDHRGWMLRFCPRLTPAERRQRHGRYSHPNCPGIRALPGRPPITFLSFTAPIPENWFYRARPHHGRFLSLRRQVSVLTGEGVPFEDACRVFGVKIPDHPSDRLAALRARLDATSALAEVVLAELRRHPVLTDEELPFPNRVNRKTILDLASPADLARTYLRASGIPTAPPVRVAPRSRMTAREALGAAASAFHAPRSETLIRHQPVPGVMIDIRSCYPASAILQGLSGWWVAASLVAEEVPLADALADLDAATPECYLQNRNWSDLTTLYRVHGTGMFPITTRERDGEKIRYNASWAVVTLPEPVWFTKAHVLLSRWRGHRDFEVLQAIRIRPQGRRPGVHPIRFRGEYDFNPLRPVESLVAIRRDLAQRGFEPLATGVKVAVNGLCYGIAAQHDRRPGREVFIYDGVRAYRARPASVDAPGSHTCWPVATFTVAGSWMLLELSEYVARQAGCEAALALTDALFLTPLNGAKPDHIARSVIEALEPLNPFPEAVRPFIRPQDGTPDAPETVTGFGVSTPAYTRYRRRKGAHGARVTEILKPNGHGLSVLLPPPGLDETAFREGAWRFILGYLRPGRAPRRPGWMDRPAVEPLMYQEPSQSREVRGLRYADGSPLRPGAIVYRRHYWTKDPRARGELDGRSQWDTGGQYREELVLDPQAPPRADADTYVTYRRCIELHAERPEHGMANPRGRGHLARQVVTGTAIRHMGRDEPPMTGRETDTGAVAIWGDVLTYEKIPRPSEVRAACTVLRRFPTATVARLLEVDRGWLPRTLRKFGLARPATQTRIVALADAIRRNHGRLPEVGGRP